MTHVWFTLGVVLLGVGAFVAIVWLAERKAKAELMEQQYYDDLRRLKDALDADARARERIDRDGLLQDDGHRRD